MYYIDVETVPAYRSFGDADERTQELFRKKFHREIAEGSKKKIKKYSRNITKNTELKRPLI